MLRAAVVSLAHRSRFPGCMARPSGNCRPACRSARPAPTPLHDVAGFEVALNRAPIGEIRCNEEPDSTRRKLAATLPRRLTLANMRKNGAALGDMSILRAQARRERGRIARDIGGPQDRPTNPMQPMRRDADRYGACMAYGQPILSRPRRSTVIERPAARRARPRRAVYASSDCPSSKCAPASVCRQKSFPSASV